MSHHLSNVALESAANRAVVVEQAPADGARSVAAAPAAAAEPSAAAPTAAAAPTSAGTSGLAGANVPVENVQSASTQIRTAEADLTTTTSAPRRLDGLDGVGGGGGGGGAGGGADVQESGGGQVAGGTANQDVSQTGLGSQTTDKQVSNDAITVSAATDGGGANAVDPTAGSTTQGV